MVVFALIAGGLALALLVVIYWRTAQRYEALQAEVSRLRVVQRDMSSDVRVRLEEGEKAWTHVEADVRPRLERLEPSVARLSTSLEAAQSASLQRTETSLQETLPALGEARSRLEAVEGRVAAAEAELRGALESGETKLSERAERIENAVRTLRNAADERLADLSARLGELETRTRAEAAPAVRAEEHDAEAPTGLLAAPASDSPMPAANTTPDPAPDAHAYGKSGAERGTPAPEEAPDGRWVFVLLVVVAGVALAISALA